MCHDIQISEIEIKISRKKNIENVNGNPIGVGGWGR